MSSLLPNFLLPRSYAQIAVHVSDFSSSRQPTETDPTRCAGRLSGPPRPRGVQSEDAEQNRNFRRSQLSHCAPRPGFCNSRSPASPTRGGRKPSLPKFPADSLTCYSREAGANLLNPFHNPALSLHLTCSNSPPPEACFFLVPHRRCRPAGHETGISQFLFVLFNLRLCFFLGHDFSRAETAARRSSGFSPCGELL
jgi:hypothetical protein